MSMLLKSGQLPDVEFIVGTLPYVKVIRTHKCLLAERSDVFRTMFYGSLPESNRIAVPDIEPQTFVILLWYAYFQEFLAECLDDAFTVYIAADKYNLTSLVKSCRNYILEAIKPSNVLDIYEMAVVLSDSAVLAKCERTIMDNAEEIMEGEKFLTCQKSTVQAVLQLQELNTNEISMILKTKDWVKNHNKMKGTEDDILKLLSALLPFIRFLAVNDRGYFKEYLNGKSCMLDKVDGKEYKIILLGLEGVLVLYNYADKRAVQNYSVLKLWDDHTCSSSKSSPNNNQESISADQNESLVYYNLFSTEDDDLPEPNTIDFIIIAYNKNLMLRGMGIYVYMLHEGSSNIKMRIAGDYCDTRINAFPGTEGGVVRIYLENPIVLEYKREIRVRLEMETNMCLCDNIEDKFQVWKSNKTNEQILLHFTTFLDPFSLSTHHIHRRPAHIQEILYSVLC